ncbi:hypothetical protein HanHA300_Chr13g0481931 [Helianthus annuus]|nr:hypothetical protein HanHA300_Chr13g0481931 [Helianthus annuus]KAJ0481193.1 hypothetical protein HanIR_Chr13g0639931 [Helianthus annuus]KAJ0663683.1 hypothetical protein HanLR1_Chr13g0483831 [Helianthus annuus]
MQENDGQSEFEEPRIKSQKSKIEDLVQKGVARREAQGGGGSFASREGLCGRFSFAPCLPLHSNRLNAAAWAPPTCFRAIRDTC